MDQNHKIWAIRAGIGAGVCAVLTAWMVPSTTPIAKPSIIAGMAGTAEAQKPTYSAVPDSAIPSWAASLRQVPDGMPSAAPPAPMPIADAGPPPPEADGTITPPAAGEAPPPDPAPRMEDEAPPPPITAGAGSPPPAPADGYQAQHAAWQARLDSVMQGQSGPG